MIFSPKLPKIFAIFREPSICNFLTKVPHLIGNGKNREKAIVFRKQRPWYFVGVFLYRCDKTSSYIQMVYGRISG